MREYGFSALTSVISERSPSSSRIARIAFMPAVPPPMTRCRAAIIRPSEELASTSSIEGLGSRRYGAHLALRAPSRLALPFPRQHALEALTGERGEPVLGGHVFVEDGRGRARFRTRRRAAAEVALERLARVRVVEHRPTGAGDRAELAAHAEIVDHVLGPGAGDGDRAHGAR